MISGKKSTVLLRKGDEKKTFNLQKDAAKFLGIRESKLCMMKYASRYRRGREAHIPEFPVVDDWEISFE